MTEEQAKPEMFPTIGQVAGGDDDAYLPTVIESLCINCEKNGETRLLLTKIPFFREVVVMSFECPHCGYRNNEIQPAAKIEERGCTYELEVTCSEDLNRHIVLADSASFTLKELEFERPSGKGEMTNLEGILSRALDFLRDTNEERRKIDPEGAEKLDSFIPELAMYLAGLKFPFNIVVDDPSGNSFVENPSAPKADKHLKVKHYVRTKEQNESLGLFVENSDMAPQDQNSGENFVTPDGALLGQKGDVDASVVDKEVLSFPVDCSNCRKPGQSHMFITDIPFFKEIIIMAFNCEHCGFRSNEIKGGGATPAKGQRTCLRVHKKDDNEEEWKTDMMRDVIKSNSAGLTIPELELDIEHGSLGGMYTTVEGLLQLAQEKFFDGNASSFLEGDSMQKEQKAVLQAFKDKFEAVRNGELAFTLLIEDPLANSYVYSPFAPNPDPRLHISEYERTADENEILGLNDINVDHYDEQSKSDNKTKDDEAKTEPKHMDKETRDQFRATMEKLQIGGSEAHPNEDVVAKPDLVTDSLDKHR